MATAAMCASATAAMATCSAIVPSSASQSARCSADSELPSTSAGINSGFVKFPLSSSLGQNCKAGAGEALFASSCNRSSSSSSSSAHGERPAVLDPALQFANLMWFKGTFNAQIFVSEDEPADSVVRRFRKAVMQAGVIPECRRRRFFETPQDIAKRKLQTAQRRNRNRRFSKGPDNFGGEKKQGGTPKQEEDDDYWGYTEEK